MFLMKADVHGSVEAVEGVLNSLPQHEVKVDIVSAEVGAPSESDIAYCEATNGNTCKFLF